MHFSPTPAPAGPPGAEAAPFQRPVTGFLRPCGLLLREDMTVEEALATIRTNDTGDGIIYFYVTGDNERLTGVLPTRRLLSVPLSATLAEVMIRQVLAVPATATLLDACELFVLHKFLAFPVVDTGRRVLGVLEISVFAREMLDQEEPEPSPELFELLGFRLGNLRGVSPWAAFRIRFPWLLITLAMGTAAALLAGAYETTLEHHVVIACFLAMVLALGEAVSMQSMSLALQAMRSTRITFGWFLKVLRRELAAALLIGLASSVAVFVLTWAWRGDPVAAAIIGASVYGAVLIAAASGFAVPALLHALRLDPKIAAGPATLACADLLTLLLYLSLARAVLG